MFQEMGHVKWKSVFKHAQNALIQIILRMRKMLSRPLFSNDTFHVCPMILLADSKGPD